ncbi:unnamed protein product [Larinioides sclopetarius]|uniref:Uncharacterized protein n=1 Tax=Larinioides sclopetarius TaxID=280406 RepID=A0AAV1Z1M3_9ARAC
MDYKVKLIFMLVLVDCCCCRLQMIVWNRKATS